VRLDSVLGETEYARFFSGRDGNQNRNQTVFDFQFSFSIFWFWFLVFFGFWFGFPDAMETKTEPFSIFGSVLRFWFLIFFRFLFGFSWSKIETETEPFSVFDSVFSVSVSRFSPGFSLSRWKPKPNGFRFSVRFFRFLVLLRFFPVEMETKTEQFSIFGFDFLFFSGFGSVFAHLIFYNSIPIPSNQTWPKSMVKFHQISFQFLQSQIPWWIPFREPNVSLVFYLFCIAFSAVTSLISATYFESSFNFKVDFCHFRIWYMDWFDYLKFGLYRANKFNPF